MGLRYPVKRGIEIEIEIDAGIVICALVLKV